MTTPYDRLVRLLATNDCDHCGRYDVPEPGAAAAMLGVSETTLRRLMDKDAKPPRWSSIEVMAMSLNERERAFGTSPRVTPWEPWTPVRLVSAVWPALDAAAPPATAKGDAADGPGE